ncbi:hypothetical protein RRG08_066443, partial [Elysia crispata]
HVVQLPVHGPHLCPRGLEGNTLWKEEPRLIENTQQFTESLDRMFINMPETSLITSQGTLRPL